HQVQFYADKLNIHPNHLNAIVKRITDTPASAHIQKLRSSSASPPREKRVSALSPASAIITSDAIVYAKSLLLKALEAAPYAVKHVKTGPKSKDGKSDD
ncbi:MAG: hypothetical protein AAGA73_05580, partial [Pseudomonadota bacterium]